MKKRMLKIAALMMAATMTVSLAACGGDSSGSEGSSSNADSSSNSDSSSSDGDKVITYWNIGTEGADKEALEYAVEEFNKNTESGYTVENVPTQNDNYKEKLVVAMSSGECPDMYTSWSGGPMNEYIESGYAQPLDDLYEEFNLKDEFMDAALAQATYNGKLYAVPTYNVSLAGVFYNKEIFEKYNLEVPQTVSELEKVCDTLKENGITPFALANGPKWTGSMYFQCLAARKGGLDPFQSAVAGEGTFEDECFQYAGEKIQEWVEKGYFPDGVNSLSEDDGQAKQLMYQETAGMMVTGSWYTGTFSSDSPEFYEKIGWFSFPKVDGSDADASIQIGTIGDQFVSFSCEGDKLKAAFECASYYASDGAKDLMVEVGKIPPTKDAADLITDGVTKQILDAATEASSVQLWYDQYLPPAVAQVHLDTCQELFGMTITPEEADKKFEEAMEEYLAE
ncbi:MAG: extracellular solute-binding protein [Ruminococcus sp.]|nr:extracellular solute-binding protein [Ruminococcus sp.]